MKYSYYPGCTLRTKAKDLDAYARASAKVLGFELEEIENWQCCGGVYPLGTDEIAQHFRHRNVDISVPDTYTFVGLKPVKQV